MILDDDRLYLIEVLKDSYERKWFEDGFDIIGIEPKSYIIGYNEAIEEIASELGVYKEVCEENK